jgi:phosphoglycerol transferase MdoB-like AlkP superfamily enzyme
MKKELKYMAFLYSQLTSLITFIILIWFLGDTQIVKNFFKYLELPLFASQVTVSFFVFFVFSLVFYKTIKKMQHSRKMRRRGKSHE